VKVLGILLGIAGLVLLGLFVRPLLGPAPDRTAAPETYSSRRSMAVTRPAAGLATPSTAARSDDAAPAPAPASAGPLCDRRYPGTEARALALPDVPLLRGRPRPEGAWTWINLWAAWCKPCKEEMPRIASWATGVRARGGALRVLFVSLDDDERQLRRYMDGDGRDVAGDFAWWADEGARARVFAALGVENPPTLPLQAILDPDGRLRCVRVGSVGPEDLEAATRVFGW